MTRRAGRSSSGSSRSSRRTSTTSRWRCRRAPKTSSTSGTASSRAACVASSPSSRPERASAPISTPSPSRRSLRARELTCSPAASTARPSSSRSSWRTLTRWWTWRAPSPTSRHCWRRQVWGVAETQQFDLQTVEIEFTVEVDTDWHVELQEHEQGKRAPRLPLPRGQEGEASQANQDGRGVGGEEGELACLFATMAYLDDTLYS